MGLTDATFRLSQQVSGIARAAGNRHVARPSELSRREVAEMMELYYFNNDLYEAMAQMQRTLGQWKEAMRPLRNPTFAVVEFYSLTLWPGTLPAALPIIAAKPDIVDPIHKVWKWSNWGARKQRAARFYAMHGDMFLRVSTNKPASPDKTATKVRIQVMNSKFVTDFDTNAEGHVIRLRYDVGQDQRNDDGTTERVTHTEIWEEGPPARVRIWHHAMGIGASEDSMGTPEETNLEEEVGIDFVPIAHAPFRDIGDGDDDNDADGLPAIWTQLSMIDEVNRKATRLAQILFRYDKPLWLAMANQVDKDGRPLPAPILDIDGDLQEGSDVATLRDDILLELPGMVSLQALVPNLDYSAYMAAIEADMDVLEQNLPELAYYEIVKASGESGRALQLKLTPATTLVNEVRGGAETALARADMMALSIGKFLGIPGFTEIGEFDKGELDHTFAERDVIPLTEEDRADAAKVWIETGMDRDDAYKRVGMTDDEIEALAPRIGPEGTPEEQDLAFQAGIDKAAALAGPVFERAASDISATATAVALSSGEADRVGGNGQGMETG